MTKIIILCFYHLICVMHVLANDVENPEYWRHLGKSDIEMALSKRRNEGIAKNVIVFVGDGMGLTTITASRIYGKTEKGYLDFEKFENIGVLKTYSANKLVPDSCSTATALFCGVKANQETAGVDASVQKDNCDASLDERVELNSIIDWAQQSGKSTGFVTNTRITHATPSALYAHTPNRRWECEAKMPATARACKDIARQLIEDAPGRDIQVIMGGGRQCLVANVVGNESDPIDTWSCYSRDGRDLIRDWQSDKMRRHLPHTLVQNNEELSGVDAKNTDYMLGVFANGHMKMDYLRDRGPKGMPSLVNMTEKAIEILRKNPKGFLLVVEGGLIDFAHHRGHARQAFAETLAFSDAVKGALHAMADQANETLMIVTSDHSHSVVFTGYAQRNSSILDVAERSKINNVAYTSILYGTGGPNNFQFDTIDNRAMRMDPISDDTRSFDYSQQAVVLTDEVKHGGADVLVYATGPRSHLFQSVHEQTYVAYVIGYAANIGPFQTSDGTHRWCAGAHLHFPLIFILIVFVCF